VDQPGYSQVFDNHQMTSGLVLLDARMNAIEAWAMTVSNTVSTNDSAVDRKFGELLNSMATKATIGAVMELEEKIQAEAIQRAAKDSHAANVLDRRQQEIELNVARIVEELQHKHEGLNNFADDVRGTFRETANIIGGEAHEMSVKVQLLERCFQELEGRMQKYCEPPQGEQRIQEIERKFEELEKRMQQYCEPPQGERRRNVDHEAPQPAPAQAAPPAACQHVAPDPWAQSMWGKGGSPPNMTTGPTAMAQGQHAAKINQPTFQQEELINERTRVYDDKTAQDQKNQYDGNERKCRAWACSLKN